jgi:hypothetical protein
MYCRIEDERLQYLREGKTRQAREVFAAEEDTQEKDDYEMELQRAFAGVLPSSFLGSRAWTSERIADALALCRIYGKPSLFITMTTNPKWLEILSRLTRGQTAADVPVVVCRVFHNRLTVLKKFLRERFGCIVYTITVVEFQKRGLPHAHLLIKVFPEIPIDHIDDVVSAELPLEKNEEDRELRRLVEEFMQHKESHLLSPESRCNKKGRCIYGFPHAVQEQTTVDDHGRVQYRRRHPKSAWTVSYIPALLQLLRCHVNVDICFTANVVLYLYKYLFKGADTTRYNIIVETDPVPRREIDDY